MTENAPTAFIAVERKAGQLKRPTSASQSRCSALRAEQRGLGTSSLGSLRAVRCPAFRSTDTRSVGALAKRLNRQTACPGGVATCSR
jgi:hypothetical protein